MTDDKVQPNVNLPEMPGPTQPMPESQPRAAARWPILHLKKHVAETNPTTNLGHMRMVPRAFE
jgi:hypothetical protein